MTMTQGFADASKARSIRDKQQSGATKSATNRNLCPIFDQIDLRPRIMRRRAGDDARRLPLQSLAGLFINPSAVSETEPTDQQ
jgi:hypothetical protein